MNIVHSLPLLLLVSCASYPPPSDHLASAIAEARAARESGAGNVPRAALQLKLAEEQIAQAQEMMKNGDNERADYMTLRAYNDAELALAMARGSAIRARVEQLQASLGSSPGPQQNPPH